MNYLDKSREQLIADLEELQQIYAALKTSYKRDLAGRRQIEQNFKEAEERYWAIFSQSPIAIEYYDAEGKLIQVNESCLTLFGVTCMEEIKGFSLFSDPNISDENRVKLSRGESLRCQQVFDFEIVKSHNLYKTSRSGKIWLDVLIKSIGSCQNPSQGFLVQIRDITEEKVAEFALRESEDKFRNLYDLAPVGLYRSSTTGQILLANRAMLDILGYSSLEELSSASLATDCFGPHYNRELFLEQIEEFGEVKNLEARWTRSDAKIILIRENARAIRGINGDILYFDGSVEDITERKQFEMALADTQRKYKHMVTNIMDVVYSVDGQTGEFAYLSPAFEKLLGYTEKDVLEMGGRKPFLAKVLPWGVSKEHDDRFNHLHTNMMGHAVTDELWWQCKDGSLKCVADHWSPVYKGDKLISTDGVLRDITQSKKTEEDLNDALVRAEASDRLKTAFLNNISHEVRTPLNGILGFAEMIDDPDISAETRTLYRDILHESSDRLLNTINSYMDISLLVSGNLQVRKEEFDLQALLDREFAFFVDQAAAKGVKLEMIQPEESDCPMVFSDPYLIRKVFNHLLSNAVKFTEYGTVFIRRKVTDRGLEVTVEDPGIGISEELSEKIFDSFLQADVSNTRKHEGSGLGLAIAKGIIELLGGKIWVNSELGSGSTFGFSIPCHSALHAREGEQVHLKHPLSDELPVVLIAEDDPINIFLLETMLCKSKAAIWHVENGLLAVECCQMHPEVSVVLMDLKMPVMDGFEATRKIKAFRKDLPIIAVTAFAMPGDRTLAMDAGCDDYLAKPFNTETILKLLSEYITL
jgi:PAS domain S-box-containing protein